MRFDALNGSKIQKCFKAFLLHCILIVAETASRERYPANAPPMAGFTTILKSIEENSKALVDFFFDPLTASKQTCLENAFPNKPLMHNILITITVQVSQDKSSYKTWSAVKIMKRRIRRIC